MKGKTHNILRRDLPFLYPGLKVFVREPVEAMIFYAINDNLFKMMKGRDVMDWMGYIVRSEEYRIVHRVVVFGRPESHRAEGMFTALTIAGETSAVRIVNFTDTDDIEKLMLTASSEDILNKVGVAGRMAFG